MPPFTTTSHMSTLDGIQHGFFGRQGGVSSGIYGSLNLGTGSGDNAESVRTNRQRVQDCFKAEHLISSYQIHSAKAVIVEGPADATQQADGLVTATPGVALCILTADCVPVLFADPKARIIGAAHAGWKGAITGICAATLDCMERLGATRANIVAAIGPAIQQPSYEVGPEFREQFLAHDRTLEALFKSGRDDRYQFDLTGFVKNTLLAEGISALDKLDHDTCAMQEVYFSNRRRNHRKEPDYGRNGSVIVMTG